MSTLEIVIFGTIATATLSIVLMSWRIAAVLAVVLEMRGVWNITMEIRK